MKTPALPKKFLLNSKGILAVGTLACFLSFPVQSANFGHARLDSSSNAGLDVRIPVNKLSSADLDVLSASAAPAEQWQANGLTPPVDLASMRFNILSSGQADSSILQVISDQPYQDSIIDLLLNVTTASGVEPYQVSLIVPPSAQTSTAKSSSSSEKDKVGSLAKDVAKSIQVQPGDTMFAIAKRNAVDGVSVYQLMMALHRTNPQAFIKENVNLVKAGANLDMPSMQEMLAISDAHARRQFVAHTNALASGSANQSASQADISQVSTTSGQISAADTTPRNTQPDETIDKVKLGAATESDAAVSKQHALEDTKVRVSQLEDNVKNLNEALQSQGKAASELVTDGAKIISDSFDQISGSGDSANAANNGSVNQNNTQVNARQAGSGVDSAGSSDAAVSGLAGTNNQGSSQSTANAATANDATDGESNSSSSDATSNQSSGQGSAANGQSAANDIDNKSSNGGNAGSDTGDKSSTGININASNGAANAAGAAAAGSATNSAAANNSNQTGAKADGSNNGATGNADKSNQSTSASAQAKDSETSWLDWADEHVIGLFIAAMAVMVLILVWLLRILNKRRDKRLAATADNEKLQAKLDEIDLDLDSDSKKQ